MGESEQKDIYILTNMAIHNNDIHNGHNIHS